MRCLKKLVKAVCCLGLSLVLLAAASNPVLAEGESNSSNKIKKLKNGRRPVIRSRLNPVRIIPKLPGKMGIKPNAQILTHPENLGKAIRAATPKQGYGRDSGPAKPVKRTKRNYKKARNQKYNLDFAKADIGDVIKVISEMIGQNFILTDKTRSAKITIMTPRPVSAQEAYQAFLAALSMNRLAVVPYGNYLKIVEKKDARGDAIKIYDSPDDIPPDDRLITYILRLQYADVKDIETVIKQIKSREGNTVAYLPMNTLVLNEMAHNLKRILKVVSKLDIPSPGSRIRIMDIQYADASDIVDTIKELFGEKSKRNKRKAKRRAITIARNRKKEEVKNGTAAVTVDTVMADERTNKLIVICTDSAWTKVRQLIDELDVPVPGDEQIHVHYLENADATELATVLSNLAQGRVGRTRKRKRRGKKSPKGTSSELFEGEVKITADKATNSLVIVASSRDYASLRKVIKKLDIRRRQVFVEATILEVSLKKDNKAGFAWNAGKVLGVSGEDIPLFFGTNLSGLSSLALTDPSILSGIAAGLRGPDVKGTENLIPGLSTPLPSFGAILIALQENSNVNVLSSPHILTTDNEEASITVGKNVPFIMGFTGYGGAGRTGGYYSNPVVSIQRQDVALTLKLTPQINESDYVRLKVEQEVTELAKGGDVRTGPITSKRAAKTTVVVKDQQTVVLGGLMQDKVSEGSAKVPFLGDIPVIGWLFRFTDKTKEKTNLLIFLTPYIIKDPSDFRKIFKRKMRERKEFIERFYGEAKNIHIDIDYSRKKGPLADIESTLYQEKKEAQERKKENEKLKSELPRVRILGNTNDSGPSSKAGPGEGDEIDEQAPAENGKPPEKREPEDETGPGGGEEQGEGE
ncbi:MAG: type II secretion system secretin GspD [Deltaproteobacteria bacterium]|nr:type II secretion system secretin GspD [Deltaproteobacteria bacterium]